MVAGTPSIAWQRGDDLPSIIERYAREGGGRVALVQGERRLTWSDLHDGVERIASALLASGVRPKQRVAALADNSPEYAACFFGALRIGACVVPLPTLASPDALERMVVDSAPAALFVAPKYADVGAAIAGRTGVRVSFAEGVDGFGPWESFLGRAAGRAAEVPIAPGDEFDVIYSSGTTGIPKGIVHSHAARKASYGGSRASYFSTESVNVIATPFYSNTTTVTWFITTARGGTNVLLGKFSPEAFLDAVETHAVTHAMLVPVQYERILSSPRFATFSALARQSNQSTLRYLFSTSAPLRAETKRRILDETRADLVEIYGLTEGGPVTVLEARSYPEKLSSVGRPSAGVEVRIVDDQGAEVPAGTAGEVLGRSANMMSGYLNRQADTDAMVFRAADGTAFFRTGDLGRIDEDGFLYLLDRKKDVIISGGFNVYATDLEGVLAHHPAVAEVAVIGIPSDRWGETPLALVVLRPGTSTTAEELCAHCNERVGKAQRLSGVELRDALPRNAIGKVVKRDLREPYWRAAT
jgi:acyl-CoA synthetase (AMP-forming)/AMP-acid ligase II